MISQFVEESFSSLGNVASPFVGMVSAFSNAKNQTLGQTLGLGAPSADSSLVTTVDATALASATSVLESLSVTPYTAVLVEPTLFRNAHPILNYDDIPPWERLTLDNFLFVLFLDEWCRQGKKTCGFFENP